MRKKKTLEELYTQRKVLRQELNSLGPIVRGAVVESLRTCGKPNCKCQRGEKHRSNYFTRSVHSKTLRFYLPPEVVEAIRTWCNNYKELKAIVEELSEINIEILRRKIRSSRASRIR